MFAFIYVPISHKFLFNTQFINLESSHLYSHRSCNYTLVKFHVDNKLTAEEPKPKNL